MLKVYIDFFFSKNDKRLDNNRSHRSNSYGKYMTVSSSLFLAIPFINKTVLVRILEKSLKKSSNDNIFSCLRDAILHPFIHVKHTLPSAVLVDV